MQGRAFHTFTFQNLPFPVASHAGGYPWPLAVIARRAGPPPRANFPGTFGSQETDPRVRDEETSGGTWSSQTSAKPSLEA
jgi:hypothetical protein